MRAAPLLAQLGKLEELRFDRGILHSQRSGRWFPIGGLPSEFSVEDRSPADAAPDVGAGFGTPKSHALLKQAVSLEQQADELEERELQRSGNAEGSTRQGLVADAYGDETRLAPTPAEIEAWANAFEVQFKGRYRTGITLVPQRYRLVWRAGSIDEGSSFIEFEAAARQSEAA